MRPRWPGRRPVTDRDDYDATSWDNDEAVTEAIKRAELPAWDGTTFGGASGPGLPVAAIAIQLRDRHSEPLALARARPYVPDTFPALPPAPEPEPAPVLAAVPVTEPARIGDELRLPVIWCEMPRCISWFGDPASAGFADARDRAAAAGWRHDALGRLTCPACQQADPAYRTPAPLAWHHPEIRRRWNTGHRPGEDTTDMLAVEAELGRRISRENPALARDIGDATRRHARHAAGGAR